MKQFDPIQVDIPAEDDNLQPQKDNPGPEEEMEQLIAEIDATRARDTNTNAKRKKEPN
jgi:hypothetical protein